MATDDFFRARLDQIINLGHPLAAKVLQAARRAGIVVKQTFSKEGKALQRIAGGYAHAEQFKRLRRTVKRQRTILGIVLREVRRKLPTATSVCAATLSRLNTLLERAERIFTQQPKDEDKLYAWHAPEAECIGKGKAREPYEFGVKASIAVTHKNGLLAGGRADLPRQSLRWSHYFGTTGAGRHPARR